MTSGASEGECRGRQCQRLLTGRVRREWRDRQCQQRVECLPAPVAPPSRLNDAAGKPTLDVVDGASRASVDERDAPKAWTTLIDWRLVGKTERLQNPGPVSSVAV